MENSLKKYDNEAIYINSLDKYALVSFNNVFQNVLGRFNTKNKKIIILCIGTDRATGDCLGPLIGYKLKAHKLKKEVIVYGSLEEPIHAQNLEEKLFEIKRNYPNSIIVAIDACLGRANHISHICVGIGSIKPGAGVKKELPEVGDIFITGIVNSSFSLEISILQSTRLSIVMQMAEIIANGIWLNLRA